MTNSELIGEKPDGSRINITAKIGQPYRVYGNKWACPISLTPLHDNLADVRGQDSFHALSIACATVIALLIRFKDQGGKLLTDEKHEYHIDHIYSRLYKRPKRKIPFNNLIKRITGISTPVFGISWNPPEQERDVANRVLTILEDQRLLFGDYTQLYNLGSYAEKALYNLRVRLTEELSSLDRSTPLAQSLSAMRSACRKCLDQLENASKNKPYSEFCCGPGEQLAYWFGAIGELRSTFGLVVAKLSTMYGIEVEEELSTILPQDFED